jgi:hypothetical protein
MIDENPLTSSPGITLSVAPATQTLSGAGSVVYSGNIVAMDGFGGNVTVSVTPGSNWPSGITYPTVAQTISVTAQQPGLVNLTFTSNGSVFQGQYSFTVTATPSGAAAQTWTGTLTIRASSTQTYTVTTNPVGLSVTVDNQVCSATPCAYTWLPGSQHSIATVAAQTTNSGTFYAFSGWSDNGALAHQVTPSAPTTFTAAFDTVTLYTDDELVALDSGDTYALFAAWSDSSYVTALVQGASLSRNGSRLFGPTDGTSGPSSSVQLPSFSLNTQGFGNYGFAFTPSWYLWCYPGYYCWEWGGTQLNDTITYPQPSLASLSPTYGYPGSTVQLTITGTGLGIRDADANTYKGVTSVNIAGGISPTIQPLSIGDDAPSPVPPSTELDVSLAIPANITPGTYNLTVTAFGYTTGPLSFTVPDLTPQITNVNPSTVTAGPGFMPITITGTGFGTNQGLDSSQIAIQPANSGLAVNAVTSWTPTQITATIAATTAGDFALSILSNGAAGNGFSPAPQTSLGRQSNAWVMTASPNPVTLTLTRESLTSVLATGSPPGGRYMSQAVAVAGGTTAQLDANTVNTTTGTITLVDPQNPLAGPSPGGLAQISTIYIAPSGISALKQFTVPTFGVSCYFTASETDYMTGQACTSGSFQTAKGVSGTYCSAFLTQVTVQGSGITRQGNPIKYNTGTKSFYFQSPLLGGDGTPVVAGQTVARDRNIIPTGGVFVSLDGVGDNLLANDVGDPKRVVGWRIDLYRGIGKSVCLGWANPMAIGACSPGSFECPASTIQ